MTSKINNLRDSDLILKDNIEHNRQDKVYTEWFSVQQDPPTVGWYEYKGWLIDEGTKLYWNGYQWGYWINEQPRRNWTQMAVVITDKWRGLYA